jgi:hypothetical protein
MSTSRISWSQLRVFDIPRVKIFVSLIIAHLLIQIALNAILPFPLYSELSSHDGAVYYDLAKNPLPEHTHLLSKRFQRPLLPLTVWTFFSWERHIGFAVVNIVAISIGLYYFYRIAQLYYPSMAGRLTILAATIPYLLSSTHLAMTEPLLLAGLLGGYYHARRGALWKAALGYGVAMLTKEIALLPFVAELIIQWRNGGVRRMMPLFASLVPVGGWYLLVGLKWGNLWWMLDSPKTDFGFFLTSIYNGATHQHDGWPISFCLSNQLANITLLSLSAIGLFALRKHWPLVVWAGISIAPLLFLSMDVYGSNFDFGRQMLPALLLLLALPRRLLASWFYWIIVAGLVATSLFWTLYHARFFVFWKL